MNIKLNKWEDLAMDRLLKLLEKRFGSWQKYIITVLDNERKLQKEKITS